MSNDIIPAPKYDFSAGNDSLGHSIKRGFPQLNDSEIQELGNIIIREVSNRIATGEKIAFFSKDEDGEPILTLLSLEVVETGTAKIEIMDGKSEG